MACERLPRPKKVVAAEVDHIVPIERSPELAFDEANLQSLCQQHHSSKTARERGGRFVDYRHGRILVARQESGHP